MLTTDMADSSYVIRNYQPADFSNYVLLHQEAEKLEPGRRSISTPTIAEGLARPNYSPEQDLFVVIKEGSIIGYMDVVLESDIGRVILDCWLYPEHRRKGLATNLLDCTLHRARETGARVAHVNVMEGNVIAKTVLSRLGFKYVRQFLGFNLDMAKLRWREANQAAQECCHLRFGEEEKLTLLQNRCFTGTWGYNPNTVTTITYRTRLSHFSPEDIILTYEDGKLAGYCWTEMPSDREDNSQREGRIFMLGVDPDYRGRGMGRRLLLAGLAHLISKGVRVTRLTVDSENREACALYRSAGFEFRRGYLWYEKAVA